MSVDITVYGGAREIGGNQILLRDGDTSVLLDFGYRFSISNEYFFSDFLKLRDSNGLNDYFEMNAIPPIPEIYRTDYLRHDGYNGPIRPVDAVLISHAHMDHTGQLNLLNEKTPFYASDVTIEVMRRMEEASNQMHNIEDGEKFRYYTNRNGGLSRIEKNRSGERKRWEHRLTGPPERIGSLNVEMIRVDHSLPGASAYIIRTSKGTIAYTGDLRFHGKHPEYTKNFVERAASEDIDLLITEGTRVARKQDLKKEEKRKKEGIYDNTTPDDFETEGDIEAGVGNYISGVGNGMVIVNFPERDIDRLMSFYRAAVDSDRILAISPQQAMIMSGLYEKELLKRGTDIANPLKDEYLRIFVRRAGYGEVCDRNGSAADTWQQDYASVGFRDFIAEHQERIVCWKDLRAEPEKYVLSLNNYYITELIDLRPPEGSLYIKSSTEPFDKEMELDWEKMTRWLDRFGLLKGMKTAHVSGHASRDEIKEMVEAIGPRMVMPVHTTDDGVETFNKWFDNVVEMSYGSRYEMR